jgi:hypothetical protein
MPTENSITPFSDQVTAFGIFVRVPQVTLVMDLVWQVIIRFRQLLLGKSMYLTTGWTNFTEYFFEFLSVKFV